jgi:hypothetical protein
MPPGGAGIHSDRLAGVILGDGEFFELALFRVRSVFWNEVADIDVSARELDEGFKIAPIEAEYLLQFSDSFFRFELSVEPFGNPVQPGDIRAVVPAACRLRFLPRCDIYRVSA